MASPIVDFLTEWLAVVPAVDRVLLAHIGDIGQRGPIDVVMVEGAPFRDAQLEETAAKLATRMLGKATKHATAVGAEQGYSIVAMRGPETLGIEGFRAGPPAALMGGDLDGGARSSAKHVLRAGLDMMKLATSQHAALSATLGQENERLRNRCARLEDSFDERIKLVGELQDRRGEQEIELAAQKARERWGDHFVENLLPVLVSQMSGATPVAKLLRTFSTDQFRAFASMCTDEQKELLGEIIGLDVKATKAEKKLVAAPPPEDTKSAPPQEGASA